MDPNPSRGCVKSDSHISAWVFPLEVPRVGQTVRLNMSDIDM